MGEMQICALSSSKARARRQKAARGKTNHAAQKIQIQIQICALSSSKARARRPKAAHGKTNHAAQEMKICALVTTRKKRAARRKAAHGKRNRAKRNEWCWGCVLSRMERKHIRHRPRTICECVMSEKLDAQGWAVGTFANVPV